MINENDILTIEAWNKPEQQFAAKGSGLAGMKYTCDRLGAVSAANIKHAARIFANRLAHEKYGPKARCRKLRVQAHRGAHGACFEAFVGIPPADGDDVGESYVFVVHVVRELSKSVNETSR
jgi:hypothetical protein